MVYAGLQGDRRRRPVAPRGGRSHPVVVISPGPNHHLRLPQAVEDLPLQALVLELAVEALAIPVLPGAAGLDVQRTGPEPCQPLPQSFGDHLRAVVAANML